MVITRAASKKLEAEDVDDQSSGKVPRQSSSKEPLHPNVAVQFEATQFKGNKRRSRKAPDKSYVNTSTNSNASSAKASYVRVRKPNKNVQPVRDTSKRKKRRLRRESRKHYAKSSSGSNRSSSSLPSSLKRKRRQKASSPPQKSVTFSDDIDFSDGRNLPKTLVEGIFDDNRPHITGSRGTRDGRRRPAEDPHPNKSGALGSIERDRESSPPDYVSSAAGSDGARPMARGVHGPKPLLAQKSTARRSWTSQSIGLPSSIGAARSTTNQEDRVKAYLDSILDVDTTGEKLPASIEEMRIAVKELKQDIRNYVSTFYTFSIPEQGKQVFSIAELVLKSPCLFRYVNNVADSSKYGWERLFLDETSRGHLAFALIGKVIQTHILEHTYFGASEDALARLHAMDLERINLDAFERVAARNRVLEEDQLPNSENIFLGKTNSSSKVAQIARSAHENLLLPLLTLTLDPGSENQTEAFLYAKSRSLQGLHSILARSAEISWAIRRANMHSTLVKPIIFVWRSIPKFDIFNADEQSCKNKQEIENTEEDGGDLVVKMCLFPALYAYEAVKMPADPPGRERTQKVGRGPGSERRNEPALSEASTKILSHSSRRGDLRLVQETLSRNSRMSTFDQPIPFHRQHTVREEDIPGSQRFLGAGAFFTRTSPAGHRLSNKENESPASSSASKPTNSSDKENRSPPGHPRDGSRCGSDEISTPSGSRYDGFTSSFDESAAAASAFSSGRSSAQGSDKENGAPRQSPVLSDPSSSFGSNYVSLDGFNRGTPLVSSAIEPEENDIPLIERETQSAEGDQPNQDPRHRFPWNHAFESTSSLHSNIRPREVSSCGSPRNDVSDSISSASMNERSRRSRSPSLESQTPSQKAKRRKLLRLRGGGDRTAGRDDAAVDDDDTADPRTLSSYSYRTDNTNATLNLNNFDIPIGPPGPDAEPDSPPAIVSPSKYLPRQTFQSSRQASGSPRSSSTPSPARNLMPGLLETLVSRAPVILSWQDRPQPRNGPPTINPHLLRNTNPPLRFHRRLLHTVRDPRSAILYTLAAPGRILKSTVSHLFSRTHTARRSFRSTSSVSSINNSDYLATSTRPNTLQEAVAQDLRHRQALANRQRQRRQTFPYRHFPYTIHLLNLISRVGKFPLYLLLGIYIGHAFVGQKKMDELVGMGMRRWWREGTWKLSSMDLLEEVSKVAERVPELDLKGGVENVIGGVSNGAVVVVVRDVDPVMGGPVVAGPGPITLT